MSQLQISEDGLLLGTQRLPGIVQSVEVKGQAIAKELKVQGGSGKAKQPMGFDDGVCRVSVKLLDDDTSTSKEKLEEYARVFKATDDQVRPFTYGVLNEDLAAHGIREVFIKDIRSTWVSAISGRIVELTLAEHRPLILKKELESKAKRRVQSDLLKDLTFTGAANAVFLEPLKKKLRQGRLIAEDLEMKGLTLPPTKADAVGDMFNADSAAKKDSFFGKAQSLKSSYADKVPASPVEDQPPSYWDPGKIKAAAGV